MGRQGEIFPEAMQQHIGCHAPRESPLY